MAFQAFTGFPHKGSGANFPAGGNISNQFTGRTIPTFYNKEWEVKFYKASVLPQVCNTAYEGTLSKYGDNIIVPTIPNIPIRKYEAGQTLEQDRPTPGRDNFPIPYGAYFNFSLQDLYRQQSQNDVSGTFEMAAVKDAKTYVENYSFYRMYVNDMMDADADTDDQLHAAIANQGDTAGANTGCYDLGTDTDPITYTTGGANGTEGEDLLNTVFDLGSVLDESDQPEDGRFLIINSKQRNVLLKTSLGKAYLTGDDKSPYRTGYLGMIDRFEVFQSELLPKGNEATSGGTTGSLIPALNTIEGGTGAVVAESNLANAKQRRLMVAGNRYACSFALTMEKIQRLPAQNEFAEMCRGLAVWGAKTMVPESLAIAQVAE